MESFWSIKSWVSDGSKFRFGIPSNWRIFESNWLSISSQFDSDILQLLGITGQILVPSVTQLFRSKFFSIFRRIFLSAFVERNNKWKSSFTKLFVCRKLRIGRNKKIYLLILSRCFKCRVLLNKCFRVQDFLKNFLHFVKPRNNNLLWL